MKQFIPAILLAALLVIFFAGMPLLTTCRLPAVKKSSKMWKRDWRSLLLGVNIGGLGTPVASLASLITIKLYLNSPHCRGSRFLSLFLAMNGLGLVLLLAAARLLC